PDLVDTPAAVRLWCPTPTSNRRDRRGFSRLRARCGDRGGLHSSERGGSPIAFVAWRCHHHSGGCICPSEPSYQTGPASSRLARRGGELQVLSSCGVPVAGFVVLRARGYGGVPQRVTMDAAGRDVSAGSSPTRRMDGH